MLFRSPLDQHLLAAIRTLVIRMATENPTWGTGGRRTNWSGSASPIAACTVWQVLHAAGIDPVPRRTGPTWKQFLPAQAHGIIAVDFAHVDTLLLRRLYA